ncbi:hypothetical protein EW145_g1649 [Phellinidium pouzarii]|uniref:Uncharacterized protein n=1 Tax=Phellinidium pouzarii TaxID=167371 RepID=A0A4S4LDP7_9AGAM|nr:hypothetical protein EW145_g1649 [Phellinidium pouzarii]
MWVIEGPFDGEPGDLERKKLKLLKPSRSYPLGRKAKHPLQLVLSHPKVSAEQVTFVVGEHSVNSINDPAFRPTLTMLNHKNKALQVSRVTDGRKDRFVVEPLSEGALCSGDVVALVTGIYVSIHWRPVCCYAPPKTPSIAFDKCASLGVKVVSTPHPEVTHQLTATLSATSLVAGSLLALEHLVRPDWLTELLHLGDSSASTDSLSTLEKDFRLPAEAQHRPAFAASLAPQLKTFSLWEPSNKRVDLFKGWRFVFVGERGRELDIETRTLVERGRGEYETFDVSGGATRWRQMLSRNKRKAEAEGGKGLGVIGDSEPLKLAAGDSWDNMQDVLRSRVLSNI